MWHNAINNVLFKPAKYEPERHSLSLKPCTLHVLGATKLISMLANSSHFQTHFSQFNLRSSSLLFLIVTFLPTCYRFRGLLLFVITLSDTHAHTQLNRCARTHTHTLGGTSLDEWSARRRGLYLTTHNIHKRNTSITLTCFEPAIPARERPQTHAVDWGRIQFLCSDKGFLCPKMQTCSLVF